MKFEAVITHNEAHFNPTAYANIPEYWECLLVQVPLDVEDDFCGLTIYGTSQDSREDAIDDLICQMKSNGWSGRLKVNG